MGTLTLQKYQRLDSLADKSINSLGKAVKSKKKPLGNTTLTNKGFVRSQKPFLEYFINDKPLSEQLDKIYNTKTTILENWVGALGSGNPKTDRIKVKQLLQRKVSDKEIRDVYPSSWTEDEFQWYLDKYREELENPEVLIYCCAECGDYDCGGIAVTIDQTENSVVWNIIGASDILKFEFDKNLYFGVFNNYLNQIAK
ncbi:hypothetical protein [Niastella populi]|nr:hypothetical protein [Niastella populi]